MEYRDIIDYDLWIQDVIDDYEAACDLLNEPYDKTAHRDFLYARNELADEWFELRLQVMEWSNQGLLRMAHKFPQQIITRPKRWNER